MFPRSISSLMCLAAGLAVGLSACALLNPFLDQGNVLRATVGDCFDESAMSTALESEDTSKVELVDCSEPHDFEVFHIEELAKGGFPGEVAVGEAARQACEGDDFKNFIGVEYLNSEIYSWSLVPQVADWEESNNREIVCYLGAPEGAVSGTLEGADR